MALTDTKIKALKPSEKRMQVSDGRGLSLDVLPSGKLSWLYRYRLNGKYERVPIGHYPDVTLRLAREKRDEMAALLARGKSPAEMLQSKRRGAGILTVSKFADRYFQEQVMKNWKDPRDVRRYLKNEIEPTLGPKLLNEVTVLDVQAVVYRKRDNGRVSSALQIRRVLKQMYDYALELQLVNSNPAAQVATRYIGKARKRTRVLTPHEIKVYLRTVYQSNIRRQFKLALHIILLTLSRKSELLSARWKDVNFETGEWLISAENAKNGKPHIVYMSQQVVEMMQELNRLAGYSELVMPGRGSLKRPFADNALNKALEGLTFDMDPLTIHDLRRTGATLLRENGFEAEVVEKALSHEAQGIKAVYIIAEYAEQRKRMLQWWADYVDSIVNESKVIEANFKRS
jgi:integrase